MIYPSENITKKYYFVNNNVIYDISTCNDADGCAQTPWAEAEKIKEEQAKQGAAEDKKETEKLVNEELAKHYPHIKITYNRYYTDDSGNEKKGGTEYFKYLWLDQLIADGDTYDGTEFKSSEKHGNGDYEGQYDAIVKDDIAKRVISMGNVNDLDALVKAIRKYYPYYIAFDSEDSSTKEVSIDGYKSSIVSIDGLTTGLISEKKIKEIVKKYAEQKALETANSIVSKIGEKYESVTLNQK